MTNTVKRYSYGYHADGFGEGRTLGLIEKEDGNLVRYEDYELLREQRDSFQRVGILAMEERDRDAAARDQYRALSIKYGDKLSDTLKERDALRAELEAARKLEPVASRVYVVFAGYDYDGSEPLKAFASEADAEAFADKCQQYQSTKTLPENDDGYTDAWFQEFDAWKAKHPGGRDCFNADRFYARQLPLYALPPLAGQVSVPDADYTPTGYDNLWRWFGLSYGSWLTLPRVLMHAMPDDWQGQMADLLEQWDQAWNTGHLPAPEVTAKADGKYTAWPAWLLNYRHPDKAEIEALRATPSMQVKS